MTLPLIFFFVVHITLLTLTIWRNLSWSIKKACDESDKIIVVSDINVDFFNVSRTHLVNELL